MMAKCRLGLWIAAVCSVMLAASHGLAQIESYAGKWVMTV
jgi:hypothetical protein